MNDRTFPARDAHRLDDPERRSWLPPSEILANVAVEAGLSIADIGSGTGFFAIPLAEKTGPRGKVYAVDIQYEMLAILKGKLSLPDAPRNIEAVLGDAVRTNLPRESCHLVFMANLWHELDDHAAVLRESARILRANGRLAILDWRSDLTGPPGPPREHRISMQSVLSLLTNNGWSIDHAGVPGQYSYLVVASRRAEPVI